MNIESITRSMNALASQISIQQAYIAKHGASNDADSDSQWESYKAAAAANLAQWDKMKSMRDSMKAQA